MAAVVMSQLYLHDVTIDFIAGGRMKVSCNSCRKSVVKERNTLLGEWEGTLYDFLDSHPSKLGNRYFYVRDSSSGEEEE